MEKHKRKEEGPIAGIKDGANAAAPRYDFKAAKKNRSKKFPQDLFDGAADYATGK